MKILNLYSGIGGNRKLWGDKHDITAVELDPEIADIYSNFFPNDNVIVDDAHDYLINNYQDFDFIWSSPPCPTHSRFQNLIEKDDRGIRGTKDNFEHKQKRLGFFVEDLPITSLKKRNILNNCVLPQVGLAILQSALQEEIEVEKKQDALF